MSEVHRLADAYDEKLKRQQRAPYVELNTDQRQTALVCPRCRSTTLRHHAINVFYRAKGDRHFVFVSSVQNGLSGTHRIPCEEVGPEETYRDGICVEYQCDTCRRGGLFLEITQHKGQTFLEWRFDPIQPRLAP